MKRLKMWIAAVLSTLAASFERLTAPRGAVALPNELGLINEHGIETLIIQPSVAPVTGRYLLYKRGAAGANYADVCTASDTPLGPSSDSPYQDNDLINIRRLGARKGFELGIAATAMVIDGLVIPAAAGKVQALTGAAAANYYVIGRCNKSVAAGAEVPYVPCTPFLVTMAGNGTVSVAAPA